MYILSISHQLINNTSHFSDKIATEASGKSWSEESSTANSFVSRVIPKSATTGQLSGSSAKSTNNSRQDDDYSSSGYQSYQASDSVKAAKEDFFSRRQAENASRPE